MPVSCVHRCTLLLLFTFVLCFVSCLCFLTILYTIGLFPQPVHVATSIFTDETFISEISRIIPVIKVDYSRFRTAKEMAAAQEKKAISDENAAGAKAEMAKLQLQRETSASKAEQNANDAAVMAAEMAKQTLEQEADKKKETAEALAKEQAVTDLKALHTQTDLAREAARKEELLKEIEDSEASSSALNVDASNQQSDKVLRQGVVEKAESAVKSY